MARTQKNKTAKHLGSLKATSSAAVLSSDGGGGGGGEGFDVQKAGDTRGPIGPRS